MFDPDKGVWVKEIIVEGAGNIPVQFIPSGFVIPMKEILTVKGVEWTDWHEVIIPLQNPPSINGPGDLTFINVNILINGQQPGARAIIANTPLNELWIDFDPALTENEVLTIEKEIQCLQVQGLNCDPDDPQNPDPNTVLQIFIEEFPTSLIDFGDQDDAPYPTLLVSDGARHRIVSSGPFMGAIIDPEPDGQPSLAADGDDTDGSDDEDGVTFVSIAPGVALGSTVLVEVVGAGLLNAWIDFNTDGDFTDAGEQIFTDEPVIGGFNPLSYTTPGFVSSGDEIISRFRLDTAGGLAPTGYANDGEVEDYRFTFTDEQKLIGGTLIPIDATAVLIAGLSTNFSILTGLVVMGSVTFVALYYSAKKRNPDNS